MSGLSNQYPVYNVINDFGAVGDGSTNDQTAIQNALNAAQGGGTVLFPPDHVFMTSSELIVKDWTRIVAHGATIRRSVPNNSMISNTKYFSANSAFTDYSDGWSNITIEGGLWDGQGAKATTGSNIMTWKHCHDIRVTDAIIQDAAGAHGIEFDGVKTGRVLNCSFYGYHNVPLAGSTGDRSYAESIQIDYGDYSTDTQGNTDILIQGCVFDKSDTCGAPGRAIGTHNASNNAFHENIRILDNMIFQTLDVGINMMQFKASICANNTIQNTGSHGIAVTSYKKHAATANPLYNGCTTGQNKVVNNTIVNAGDDGINAVGLGTGTNGTAYNYLLSELLIEANHVYTAGGNGITVTYADHCSVLGNYVSYASNHGIYVGYTQRPSIENNSAQHSGNIGVYATNGGYALMVGNKSDYSANQGFRVDSQSNFLMANNLGYGNGKTHFDVGSCTNGTVHGNIGRMGSVAANSSSGLHIDSNSSGIMYYGNDLIGCAIMDNGTKSVTTAANRTS